MTTTRPRNAKVPFQIHHDEFDPDEDLDAEDNGMGESRGDMEEEDIQEDGYSEYSDESDETVDAAVREDMERFTETFKGIKERFRLINRIGEGTFSTVYKAEDLEYDHYDNSWDLEEKENTKWSTPPLKKRKTDMQGLADLDEYAQQRRRPKYVAIKKIYVTSSPSRIYNELELLKDITARPCDAVCPLITAFRHTDQVVAVLPYFRHTDFRDYFRNMTVPDMQIYFRSLFKALAAIHGAKIPIIHRDIKPTNFLYEPDKQRGVLVDFGLAEREGTDSKPCLCRKSIPERRHRVQNSVAATMGPSNGYPKNDSRPSRRANRAGTRGFRAPEVLFKCTEQTTKIDIWSAGVMLLTILSKRFPFFNSADDVEAMIEIATIFGLRRMKMCAYMHGAVFESNIPTIGNAGFTLEKIILWSTCRNDSGKDGAEVPLTDEEKMAVRFLERCFELDPNKRISAEEALQHEFLREEVYEDEDEMNML
ncbi:hypothetical protein G7Y89_g8761 [Cudoniella acicularis]|uniref:non-specific serine/threonine protein kinase n=1 Tax=Cudoniella acicularis TaxID=354080 RepID=A0A8H4RIL1_9HELO|nr:hypothetical protein G7Y89_g8761 [Cudoniella acicularis]